MPLDLHWQPLTAAGVDAVVQLAAAAHPGLPERAAVFREKVALFPAGCWQLVAADERADAGACLGYGLSHPWRLHQIPPLDAFLGALPDLPDCLYLHDLVVQPAARGLGAASGWVGIARSVARAHRLRHLALVSVYDTQAFWARFGFIAVPSPACAAKLTSYGPTARYMVCRLAMAGHGGEVEPRLPDTRAPAAPDASRAAI